ncbi:ATP-binding protein [Candidatus Woesearchaeota archaeon]|nr:ATP-binding protein [Candidatus Woesearchaeota archaeon]
MAYDVLIGRDEKDRESFGKKGLLYLGKSYVKMENESALSNNVYLDVNKSHVILVSGKRGSGKSYGLSVMAEEMSLLDEEVRNKIAVIMIDTMGIFWSMKYPNEKQKDELHEWRLKERGFDVQVFVPSGKVSSYQEKEIPFDFSFSFKPKELRAEDWCKVFNVDFNSPIGILIERTLNNLNGEYSIEDIVKLVTEDKKAEAHVRLALQGRFEAAQGLGIFDVKGIELKDLIQPGKTVILDVSCYEDWNVKSLVVGLLGKKLLSEMVDVRKKEEMNIIREHQSIFEENKSENPLVWLMIDEAQDFLPRAEETPASRALIRLLREGRQPGISMVLATQQPGEIHRDVMTQADIVISHRITAQFDIEALNMIMQTYLAEDILGYLNDLPNVRGSGIILDDNSERIYSFKVRPKMSWHGGDAPSAVKVKKKLFES